MVGGGDVPYFDGGEYGAIAYIDDNGELQYYTATSADELNLTGHLSEIARAWDVVTLPSGKAVASAQVRAYSCGTTMTVIPNGFLANVTNLTNFYGLERVTSIGQNFLLFCIRFNQELVLSDQLTTIGQGFLSSCYTYNQPISLPDSVTYIPDNFMSNCRSFNSTIRLPSNLTAISSNFLNLNLSFNQPISVPEGVSSIGANFLRFCTSYNSLVSLPSTLERISSSFMENCTYFNQPLTIPSAVTSISSNFMYNCSKLTSLTVETTAHPTDNNSLSTTSSSAPMYATGVTLTGAGAQAWKDGLPDRTSSPYRKLIVAS